MSAPSVAEPNLAEPKPSLLRRLLGLPTGVLRWAAAHWLLALTLALAGTAATGGISAIWLVTASKDSPKRAVTLDMALHALDAQSYPQAKGLAETMLRDATLPALKRGGPAFVLGAATAYEAEEMGAKARTAAALIAARYLEDAKDRGFPPGRQAEGTYLLARSLYQSKQWTAARPELAEALALNPSHAAELHRLLAEACLNDARPRLAEAVKHNEALLKSPGLSEGDRVEALVLQAQILFRMDKKAECAAVLNRLPPAARELAEALLLRAQLLMAEAKALAESPSSRPQSQEKYLAAIKLLRQADSRDTLGGAVVAESMYLIGLCFVAVDDERAAIAQFERTRRVHPDTPEALACSYREGELYHRMGKDDEALAAFRRVLETIRAPGNFANRWLPLDELRLGMLQTFEQYRAAGKFKLCVELSQMLVGVLGKAKAFELEAEADEAWGRRLLADAEPLLPSQAGAMRREGLSRLRAAGRAFEQLARDQVASRQYTEYLWNGAQAFFQGQDFTSAVALIREYLRNEARRRHPQALVLLAESLMALGRIDEALKALQECIEFHPRDPATYRARYLASRACVERGMMERAESLLRENLSGEFLSPASKEWRDSLFALGELLHAEGRYDEAVTRLDEALQRYPEAPQAIEARYLLADSYRRLAQSAADKLKQDLPATSQLVHSKEIHDNLQRALDHYKRLQDALMRRQESGRLQANDRTILRNSAFALGSVLSDLGQLDAAVKAYFTAANRYQHSPEALDAYVQIAGVYRRMNKPVEARRAIEQAKVVLSRLKGDADFGETTNFNRKQWSETLDALSQL